MRIQEKINLLQQLGQYMKGNEEEWLVIKDQANRLNYWFIPEFVESSVNAIAIEFLEKDKLETFIGKYDLSIEQDIDNEYKLGIVMAGNIPLVGFHDFLMGFLAGYELHLKLSSKDTVLIKHLIQKLIEWEPSLATRITIQEMLKDCDAYIATGSNNTAQTFAYYFAKYPNLIRHNRTSIAILNGEETEEQLEALVQDIYQYFGLGCRNVSKIFVPRDYPFETLIAALNKYSSPKDHHQYLNNFDYQLALVMLNGVPYKSADHMILVESTSHFAPTAVLHYEYYDDVASIVEILKQSKDELQVALSNISDLKLTSFGHSQQPAIDDFADGEDTFQFLLSAK